jgi:hypothetical protein
VAGDQLADGLTGGTAHDFADEVAPRHRVVAGLLAGRPQGALARERRRAALPVVQILDGGRLGEARQPGLVRQQVRDGRLLLAELAVLGPVLHHRIVVAQLALLEQQRDRGCDDALGRRVDVDERAALPGPRARPILVAGPDIDDALAGAVHGQRRADVRDVVAAAEIGGERVADALEAFLHAAVDLDRRCRRCRFAH